MSNDNLRDAWIDAENKKKEAHKALLESVKGTKEYNEYKRAKRKAKRAKEDYAQTLQNKGINNENL